MMDTMSVHAVPIAEATQPSRPRGRTLLSRLARDKSGNTLAMIAMSIFPLVGLIGGGLDLSRMYIVKTRLQHACDAGALAGRRVQGGGSWNAASQTEANRFFDANIDRNAYGVEAQMQRAFVESSGRVTGTASAQLPMTLMKVFNQPTASLEVECDAEMRLPNTDVMFVLDVTGSMGGTIAGDTESRIVGLRRAVKCFYETLTRTNTDAACVGGDPSGGISAETQVRFGFVPYSTNVNVGRLLPTSAFRNSWTYQSRQPVSVYGTFASWHTDIRNTGVWSGWVDQSTPAPKVVANSSACNDTSQPIPADGYIVGAPATGDGGDLETADNFRAWIEAVERDYQRVYVSATRVCKIQLQTRPTERRAYLNWATATTPGAIPTPSWRYEPVTVDVGGLKSGASWNSSFTTPLGYAGSNLSVTWDGCVEERQTVRAASYLPLPANAFDLDIDRLPNSENERWAPVLDDISFLRRTNNNDANTRTLSAITTFNTLAQPNYVCPVAARNMQEWPSGTEFQNYVNALNPGGNTYHDIGLIWGGRLMSPTGLFSARNANTPGGGEIERHMIFMTDGEACTSVDNYQAYGVGWFDRRQTPTGTAPTDGCLTTGTLTQQVNARTAAVCEAIKNKNISLWVIWFDVAKPEAEAMLRNCATTDRFFTARNSTQLQETFRSIANQISQLRLTS